MYDGSGPGTARVELSGATAANWVSKTANLLVDALGQPARVGLLLPLHWQTVTALLAAVTTDAAVVLTADAQGLAGCGVAFVLAGDADAAFDVGVDEVVVLSGHPLGAPSAPPQGMALDYAREVPSYADHYGGPRPGPARIEVAGRSVSPAAGFAPADRVLTSLVPPAGAGVLLGALHAGAGLVLLPSGDPSEVAAAERVTGTAGCDVPGLTRHA